MSLRTTSFFKKKTCMNCIVFLFRIPDSPHEPDLEIIPPQDPKVIPLDEVCKILLSILYTFFLVKP